MTLGGVNSPFLSLPPELGQLFGRGLGGGEWTELMTQVLHEVLQAHLNTLHQQPFSAAGCARKGFCADRFF